MTVAPSTCSVLGGVVLSETSTRAREASVTGVGALAKMSVVVHGTWRFVIFDAPRDDTVHNYCEELSSHGVKHVVRACNATYSADTMKTNGITVHEINFDDGTSPSSKDVEKWRAVLHLVEKEALATASPGADPIKIVGVHCIAGLGRSATLVAIALMDMGMNCLDCAELIRSRRRGAINAKQLEFLTKYRPVRRSLLSTIKGLLKRG